MSKKAFLIVICLTLLATVIVLFIHPGDSQPVFSGIFEPIMVINEVMSSNKSVIVDANGDSSDWIELYNAGNEPFNLEGFGLSDNPSKPGKWAFPHISIPPNSYLVIFASGKNKIIDNEVHTNFKIDAEGESIVLSDPQGNIIEEIEIPAALDSMSYGRLSENTGEWIPFEKPTPGYPNSEEGIAAFQTEKWVTDSELYISEAMADNISVLQDEDGDYVDWIELFNSGSEDVALSGFALCTNEDNLFQWRFPDVKLKAGQYLVVFCSGKNRINTEGNLHTNFKINKDMENVYLTNPKGQVLDMMAINRLSADYSCIRQSHGSWAECDRPTPMFTNSDEGYAQFIKTHNKLDELIITEVMSRNENTLPDENGYFNDWIEIKNNSNKTLNLENYWLSDDSKNIRKWRFPSLSIEPGQYMILFLSPEYQDDQGEKYLHVHFALDGLGDELYLSNMDKTILQKVTIPELTTGITYGLVDGESGYFYFSHPTPGYTNNPDSRSVGYAETPVFSVEGGFYNSPFSLTIRAPQQGAVIRYTTDGSEPGPDSEVLYKPLSIERTTVIRAVSYTKGYLPSPVITHTYLFEPLSGYATVSITTEPENLWSEETGIYTFGHDYEEVYPFHGANFWQEWEKPANIEFFEEDGSLGFSLKAGISIHGEYTQAADQKSFGIDARKKYGNQYIHYPVFPEKPITFYQSIVLRNSGQDNGNTKLRDVLVSQLMKETGLDYQAYRPSVLYLNGEYWGFYTLRESTDKHFLAVNNPGIDKDNLDIIEGNNRVHQGDTTNYKELQNYIKTHDMSVDEYYETVKAWMDIDNFIDYQIAVIYGANVDNGNIKFWRERTDGSKWRWILFDFDMAFRYPDHDTVSDVFNPEGTGSSNAFSTVIQMGLLQNQDFRDQFLRRFATHMNTTFEPQHVVSVIDQLAAEIEPEITRNYSKWKGSYSLWQTCIEKFKNFFIERPAYARMYIQQYFNLTDSQMKEYGF